MLNPTVADQPAMSRSRGGVTRALAAALVAGLLLPAAGCSKPAVQKATAKVKAQASARVASTPRPPPPPPRAADGSYTVAGLRYLEFVTGGANPNDNLPMVVVIHGHGGDPASFENHFKKYTGKARFIAPYGLYPGERNGYEWYPGGIGHHENLMSGELEKYLPGVETQVATSVLAIQKVRPSVGKITVSGFSQGGVMTYTLALRHGDEFGVACPMSGLIPPLLLKSAKAPASKPEVHGFHGDQDKRVQLSDAQRTVTNLQRLGFTADLKVFHGLGHEFDAVAPDILGCIDRGVRGAAASKTAARTR